MPLPQTTLGVAATVAAFTIWGVAPAYYKLVAKVGSGELLAHRIIWSLVILAGLVVWRRAGVRAALTRSNLPRLALTAGLVGSNWLLIILAVQVQRVTEISLGFFINPLISVLLGVVFLQERFSRAQVMAITLAGAGVGVLVVSHGQVPWISLALGSSFALYGLVRKVTPVDPMPGLLIESGILAVPALAYLVILGAESGLVFGHQSRSMDLLLALGGLISVAPLTLFLAGVKRLKLATVGLIQYIAPSLNLFLAVGIYDEPFTRAHLWAFGLIWSGLAIYTRDSWPGRVENG